MNDSATVPPPTDTPTCQALAACTVKGHEHILAGWFGADDGDGYMREHELRTVSIPWTMPDGSQGLIGVTLVLKEDFRDGRMVFQSPQILIDADSVLLDRAEASKLAETIVALIVTAAEVQLPASRTVSEDVR